MKTIDQKMNELSPERRKKVEARAAVDLKHQIETRVSAVFGLSDADMEVVRAVPIPD